MKRLILTTLLCALAGGATAAMQPETVSYGNRDVTFVSGGVGQEEIDQLKRDAADYNVKMVFTRSDGAYLSGVDVQILDRRGNAVLETTTDGPWLLANLPPGRYRVKATVEDSTLQRDLTVGGKRMSSISLHWPKGVEGEPSNLGG